MFVAGAWALSQVYRALCSAAAWRRLAVVLSLLVVPLAALAPQVMWRYAVFVAPEKDADRLDYSPLRPCPRRRSWCPANWLKIRATSSPTSRPGTPPGAPFFAYPVQPLFNFLADRPNPTRFDHFLPGTLTSRDFAEVIAELDRSQPATSCGTISACWSGKPTRRIDLSATTCGAATQEVAAFHLFLVLERRPDPC